MREPLVDGFGRVHRDLRISVTDRCNFRCTYCMPAEGMDWLPRSDVLTFEEIERIARVCVERFGVDSIRLTGGEPTVRAHLPVLVGKVAALRRGRPLGELLVGPGKISLPTVPPPPVVQAAPAATSSTTCSRESTQPARPA